MKHKNSEVIKAWADGADIEFKNSDGYWTSAPKEEFGWWEYREYRIKPEPQKEQYQPNLRICHIEKQLQYARVLIKEQDEKICELSIKLEYANKSIEILNEEQEPQYLYVYNYINTNKTYMSPTLMQDTSDWYYIGKVRVEK
jgi:hypothetical protein